MGKRNLAAGFVLVLSVLSISMAFAATEEIGFDNPATNPSFWGRDDAVYLFEQMLKDSERAKQASTADLRKWCEKKEGCRLKFAEEAGVSGYAFGKITTRGPSPITVDVDSGFSPGEVMIFADGKVGFPDGVKVSGKSSISGNIGQNIVYIKGGAVEVPPGGGDGARTYKLLDGALVPVPGDGKMSLTTAKNGIPLEIRTEEGKRVLWGPSVVEKDGKKQGEISGTVVLAEDGVLLKKASYSKYMKGTTSTLKVVSSSPFTGFLFAYRASSEDAYLTFSSCEGHESCFLIGESSIIAAGVPKKSVELYDRSIGAVVIAVPDAQETDPLLPSGEMSMADKAMKSLKENAQGVLDTVVAAGNAVIEAGKGVGEIDISSSEAVISVFKDVGKSIGEQAKGALDATVAAGNAVIEAGNVVLAKGNILTAPKVETDISAIPPKSATDALVDSFDKRWHFKMEPLVAGNPDQPGASGPLRITITPREPEYRAAGVPKDAKSSDPSSEVGRFFLDRDAMKGLQQKFGDVPDGLATNPDAFTGQQVGLEGPVAGAARQEIVDRVARVANAYIGSEVDVRDVVVQSAKTGNTFRLVEESGVRRWEQVEPVTVNGVRRWMKVDSPRYSIDNHAAFLNKVGGYSNDGNDNCGARFCIIDGRPKSGDRLGSISGAGVAAGSAASSKTRRAVTGAASRMR
ncbi:TPA: hypothetical protein HA295_01505 [Candidatus Woesearchaeota archaeon]|nr:hypothetical protein [Candidatus Woesearchaeota archaeon]